MDIKHKRRIGFMHSLEAVIAVMILLSYSSNIMSVVSDDDDWRVARLSQESREIAGVMNHLGYTDLISGNSHDTFSKAALYLAGYERMGVALSVQNLIKPVLRVGILTSDDETYSRYSNNILQNVFGEDKSVIINGRETLIEIRNTTFDSVWNNYDVIVIPINGSAIDMVGNISLMNDTYNLKLLSFLRQGKGVIQVSNLSDESFVDFDVQKNVFGISWNDTSLSPSDFNSSFSDLNPYEAGYVLHKYFHVDPFVLNTEVSFYRNVSEPAWWDMTTGIVDVYVGDTNHTIGSANCTVNNLGIPCNGDVKSTLNFSNTINSTNGIYKFDMMSLGHEDYGVLIINSTGVGYDLVHIDEDQDRNFTNDGYFSGLVQGNKIEMGGNNYIIGIIDIRGNYIELSIEEPHNFYDMNKDNEVFSSRGFSFGSNQSQFVLVESEYVMDSGGRMPVSIVNYGGFTGRTAWITDNIVSSDEWHLLRSLILWVSPKTYVISTVQDNVKDVVSSDFVLLANKDMSQPYVMTWKAWYYD